jgi:hypothetical protein
VDIEYLLDPWIKIPLGGRNHANKILQKKTLTNDTNKTQQTKFRNDDANRTKNTNKQIFFVNML